MSAFPSDDAERLYLLAYLNSVIAGRVLQTLAPTVNYQIGDIAKLPYVGAGPARVLDLANKLIELRAGTWRLRETSWDFNADGVVCAGKTRLADAVEACRTSRAETEALIARLEGENDDAWTDALGLDSGDKEPPSRELSVESSPSQLVVDLVSYAVGCMFGRYSMDVPGLILAEQGATLEEFLAKVPSPRFTPDADNVIPIVEGDWFEDDIVERFRQFLRAAFGEEHFEDNLRFVTGSLGVKTLRDYFVTRAGRSKFYDDHVQRYKKRPTYWLFSSPKGSFNALIYMHRYTPSTVSTVLNEYLREFQTKLKARLEHAERSTNAKEADRFRKILSELDEYEHDVLYPLASQQIAIDLDDGVKANYPKFGAALRKIVGLEASE